MNTHEEYMQLAVAAARQARQQGGVAIGAVLVNASGQVIASGGSLVGVTHDPTAHAEVNCIRQAAQLRADDDLFDCALYSTLEPCHMCLSTAAWAKIPTVYFGAYRKDVDETLFDISGQFSDEQEGRRMNLRDGVDMHVQGGILEAACAALLEGYHEVGHHRAKAPSASE